MSFAGVNYIAVLVAGSVAWVFGGVWYRLLARPWREAHGFSPEQVRRQHGYGTAMWPLIVSFVADMVMAWTLAGLLGHFGAVTLENGLITAAFCWVGFVLTTFAVNNIFGMRRHVLILIDGAHWLIALLIIGAIIGAWGV
jgi:hypothetical protein